MYHRPLYSLLFAILSAPFGWSQGVVITLAGNGIAGSSGEGVPGVAASLNRISGLAFDALGNLYAADEANNHIRKIAPDGSIIFTFSGSGSAGFSGDGGPAVRAQYNAPTGLCFDSAGNLYVTDSGNRRVRKILTNLLITTFAGSGSPVPTGDGGPALSAGFVKPVHCVADTKGNLYIADQGAHRVRKIDPVGNISTYAGNGVQGFSGDNGLATAAALDSPAALAVDPSGTLFITDQHNHRIRRVDTTGIISTAAFTGSSSYGGDGGPATSASASLPGAIALDEAGNLLIVDTQGNRLRKVSGGVITTVAGTGATGFSGDNGPALQAAFNAPFALALDTRGNAYLGDTENHRIRRVSGVATTSSPVITSAGVTNSASFESGVTPGGMVTIFGTGLGARPGQVIPDRTSLNWPRGIDGVGVTMDGLSVPIYRVLNLNGQEQFTVQAPFSIFGKRSVLVSVYTRLGYSTPVAVPVLDAQPGIFILDSARAGATHADGSIVTSANPAVAGETLVIYLTGLGAVTDAPPQGIRASFNGVLSRTTVTPQVSIGGLSASVAFSGLTPGYVSLYQINAVVPNGVPAGTADLTVQSNGITGNVAKVAIR